jgi:hypothetical protein
MRTRRGERAWAEVGGRAQAPWRKELHLHFERALAGSKLLEPPDYEAANRFLVKARREIGNRESTPMNANDSVAADVRRLILKGLKARQIIAQQAK